MNKYVSKVMELYAGQAPDEPARSTFHRWLIDRDQSREKHAALFRLWQSARGTASGSTLASLASLQIRHGLPAERRRARLSMLRYAAAIALLVCTSAIVFFGTKTAGEPMLIACCSRSQQAERFFLPDGSEALVNPGSTVLYPETYGKTSRTVYLTGEASFKVQKNAKLPFTVRSGNFSVVALGTEFNVQTCTSGLLFTASLISGSISVRQTDGSPACILKPGERFVYSGLTGQYALERADLDDVRSRQQGDLVFNAATLAEVLDALERRYGVSFHYRSEIFNDDKYNFRFRKHSSISCIMDVIMEVTGDLSYRKTGDSYRIIRKTAARAD
jgi:ferric-dicitrate binding protein FerR (iron transport regulator)